jgi:spermidine synthase
LRQGDFFELARTGFDGGKHFDAVLLDIDHSPEHFLDQTNESLYTSEGLTAILNQIKPGGVFALWSNDPASEEFTVHLGKVFAAATAHDIEFPNPYTNSISVNSIYVARNDR